jgi:Tfp pilus assembly PilM family ATPase
MAKRTIQTSKPGYSIGLEHDHLAIRAARVALDGRGGFTVERVEEARGDFSEDSGLLEGLRQIKSALGIGARDSLVACLSGKQVYANQMDFRRLGSEEMEQALRLELRKTVHFEVATATLDYSFLDNEPGTEGGTTRVLVGLAANGLLSRELAVLEKAGLTASVVDLLPMAVANALWASRADQESNFPAVALHVGPQVSTIVIDGEHYPFFNRNIYFAAEEVFKPMAMPADRDRRIQSLCEEVARSLSFYEKNTHAAGFHEMVLLGDFLDGETLTAKLQGSVGFPVKRMDLAKSFGGSQPVAGRFDLAVALALRGEQ